MTVKTIISGWGNYPRQVAHLLTPTSYTALHTEIARQESVIARGMGRSYGDSANANYVLQTSYFDHFVEFDEKTGKLTAEAGITLREILKFIVHKGWFLPVTPGTSYVTLGGAIASDVHGKNHHISGTFGQHLISISILLGTGEIVTASKLENTDLFHATCGGMGLTGVILNATIQLAPVKSSLITKRTIKADCIEATLEALEENNNKNYNVAWIDCLSKGKNLGRSVLMLGDHAENGGYEIDFKNPMTIPFNTPSALLNRLTMKTFNGAYWHKAKHNQTEVIPLMPYFYPLDAIGSWNKLYGKAGFLQYQCVIPKCDGIANMRKLLSEIIDSGENSILAALKQLGKANDNLLSFPTEGYTLALDFKLSRSTITAIHKLDELIVGMGGRVYLSKDAVMQELTFKATYPNWEIFEAVRENYGAIGKFNSAQSKRLGLA
jgi:decaprenylphospho-beta-D-ribofuranose 2-oxidase